MDPVEHFRRTTKLQDMVEAHVSERLLTLSERIRRLEIELARQREYWPVRQPRERRR